MIVDDCWLVIGRSTNGSLPINIFDWSLNAIRNAVTNVVLNAVRNAVRTIRNRSAAAIKFDDDPNSAMPKFVGDPNSTMSD